MANEKARRAVAEGFNFDDKTQRDVENSVIAMKAALNTPQQPQPSTPNLSFIFSLIDTKSPGFPGLFCIYDLVLFKVQSKLK
jgi:hypothetical protein